MNKKTIEQAKQRQITANQSIQVKQDETFYEFYHSLYNWATTVIRVWNPFNSDREKILYNLRETPIMLFGWSAFFLITLTCILLLIFKKNYYRKIIISIFSWLHIYNWLNMSLLNQKHFCEVQFYQSETNYFKLHMINHPLYWVNGVLFIGFMFFLNVFYHHPQHIKDSTTNSILLSYVFLFLVVYFQIHVSSCLLRFLLMDVFLYGIVLTFLTFGDEEKPTFLKYALNEFKTKRFTYFFLLWFEFFQFHGVPASPIVYFMVSLLVTISFIEWLRHILNLCYKLNPTESMGVAVFSNLIIYNNLLVFSIVFNMQLLQYFFFFFYFAYILL